MTKSQPVPEAPAQRVYPVEIKSRVWERHAWGLKTSCQPVAPRPEKEESWTARIRDISRGGLGVVLDRYFDPGTVLTLEIPESAANVVNTLLVRVVHATALLGGQWLVGCAFAEKLTEAELQNLLVVGSNAQLEKLREKPPSDNRSADHAPEDAPASLNSVAVDQVFSAWGA